MEGTHTNPHQEAEIASEDRAGDLWEEHLEARTCPTEEEWEEITWKIFTEELETRGLTEATWEEWLRG
jgi:ribonuclease BN (tRNA processing enzyme)